MNNFYESNQAQAYVSDRLTLWNSISDNGYSASLQAFTHNQNKQQFLLQDSPLPISLNSKESIDTQARLFDLSSTNTSSTVKEKNLEQRGSQALRGITVDDSLHSLASVFGKSYGVAASGTEIKRALNVNNTTLSIISLTVSPGSITENGTTKLVYTFTRTGSLTNSLTVNYDITGTAISGTDYAKINNKVTFNAGSGKTSVNVTPIDDTLAEGNKTLIITLAAGTGYTVGTINKATATIIDNEPPLPSITLQTTDATAGETRTGQTANPGVFTLTRTGTITSLLTVNYTLTGTATNGIDYNSLTGKAIFAAGSATALVNITPLDDTLFEGNETAILTLVTGQGYSLGTTKTGTVGIVDNDPAPTITVAATDAIAGEPKTGEAPNPGVVTLTRTGNLSKALTVNYTLGGTATNGTDYGNLTGTVTFTPGSATALVNVVPIDDTLVEVNETVIFTLATGTGYTVGTAKTATLTITDNDVVPPTITVAVTDATAGETLTGQIPNPGVFTLTRTGNLSQALTVNYTLSGTATKGKDYIDLTGTVTFAAGSATALVNVAAIDDNLLEANETVILTITSGTNYKLGRQTFSTIVVSNTNPKSLADFLWDNGSTLAQIAASLKNRGFDLSTIADSIKWGITKTDGTNLNYKDVAVALWSSGYKIDGRQLADLLWDKGANQQQIGQAMKYLGLSLETIADSVKSGITKADGTALNNIDVAIALWNSGYALGPNKLADLLWDNGANPVEIGQAMKYLNLTLEEIARGIKWGVTKSDGTSIDYHQVGEALWNSGYSFNARKLADLLWDNSGGQVKIAQTFNYLGLSLETIADAVKWGVTQSDGTNLNFFTVAVALWNSGYGLDTRKLADLLWDEGATQQEIGQVFKNFNWDLESIADAIDDGITNDGGADLNYTDVALALWNSGYSFDTRRLAGLLWNEGASQANIGQAIKYLGYSLDIIADAMVRGPIDFNYTDVALALWNSGHSIDTRVLAGILWNQGATQANIGQAIRYLGYDLAVIADALDDGPIDFNYIDVTLALWQSGYSFDTRDLAGLLWNEGASQGDIGQAIRYLGYDLAVIADALDDGPIDFNYNDVALALWNSGFSFDTRVLAGVLWNEGASQGNIGQAIKYLGYGLATIADAIDEAINLDGSSINFNYIDVALALWNSGYSLDTRVLAGLLWNEGASQGDIGQAIKYLGYDLATIADALDDGPIDFNYIDVALALWDSGYSIDTRVLAGLLWNEGASQGDIGQAIKYLGYGLATIADAIVDGPIDFNYIDAALALWNSGYSINGSTVAALLWNEGASQGDIGQALRVLGFSNENIGYAVRHAPGIGFNYSDVARAIWDSGTGARDSTVANIVRSLGGGWNDIYGAIKEVGGSDARAWWLATHASIVTVVNKIFDIAEKVGEEAKDVVSDIKQAISDNKDIVDIVLLPYTLPGTIIVGAVEAAAKGDVEVIVDGLKKIPVLGTAVGVLDGVIKAAQGDEKGVLEESINSALAFYGASNVITPTMVEFAVDIFWELKDLDYQGAISASLENLGMQKTIADLFVTVSWSMAANSDWENAINAALTKVGFKNAGSFVNMAWDIIDKNYKEALKTGLELVGLTNLGIDRAKADAFLNLTVAIREGKPNQAADVLIALSGNNQQIIQSAWIKDLKDTDPGNDRQAILSGLSALGFRNVNQWVDTIWAVKEGQYLNALSAVLTLGNFADGQEWVKIIDNLQKQNYVEALATAFNLAKFKDGQSLADAVLAVKKGDYVTAFYESLNLIDGGKDLADAFKYLIDFDLQKFITSMVKAAPLLLKVLI